MRFLLALSMLAFALPVRAAGNTYIVTSTDDTPTNANCAASCTLRQAINASNINDPGPGNQNTIQFMSGLTGTITLKASNGPLTLMNYAVTIIGPTSGASITVDGNHAVRVFSIDTGVTASISNLTIANGSDTFGSGIYNSGTLSLMNITFSGNVASNNGGGMYNNTLSSLTVTNSTFSGNVADVGGGICNASGTLTITNSTVGGNTARLSQGGGIFISTGTVVTLTNTLIATNTDTTSGNPPDDVNGAVTSGSMNNLIGSATGLSGITNNVNGNLIGIANPLLGPLGSYGNPNGTQTLPLLPGSLAINAGAATGAPPTDQRGMSHVGAVDIGAFESQGFTLMKTSGDNQTTGPNTAFAPLIVTVVSSGNEPIQNGVVTFAGPTTGAGILSSPLIGTIAANGQASVTSFANATAGGPYAVTVHANGANATVSFSLTNGLATAPIITGIGPVSGSNTGGNTVTLTGGGFGTTANTQVLLDGIALPASSIRSMSPTMIAFIAPAHATGSVTITVTVAGVTATGTVTYSYGQVASLPPAQPSTSPVSPANPLPPQRPGGQPSSGGAPNPLPSSRP